VHAERHSCLQVCLEGGQRRGTRDASTAEGQYLVWGRAYSACVETYSVDSCSRRYSVAAGTGEKLRSQELAEHRMASWYIALEVVLHWVRDRMSSSWAGASRDYQQDDPWTQLERIRWQDAAASTLPVAETQICTSAASSRADSLGAVCFVSFVPHLGRMNTLHARPLATLL
jgi:hypothetical protein